MPDPRALFGTPPPTPGQPAYPTTDPHPTVAKTVFENVSDFLLNLIGAQNALLERGHANPGALLGSVLPFISKGASGVRAGVNLGRPSTVGAIAEGGRDITPLLKRMGYLGFDTAAEAKQAILQHPDWAARWPADSPEIEQAIHSWKALVKAKKTPQLSPADLDEAEETLGPVRGMAESGPMDWRKGVFGADAPQGPGPPPAPGPRRASLVVIPKDRR